MCAHSNSSKSQTAANQSNNSMTNSAAPSQPPAFIEGAIGRWLEESVAVFEQFCVGPQVVIGSSMGGWMALLLAREIARHAGTSRASLAGLVLIAPAPDFTEEL